MLEEENMCAQGAVHLLTQWITVDVSLTLATTPPPPISTTSTLTPHHTFAPQHLT